MWQKTDQLKRPLPALSLSQLSEVSGQQPCRHSGNNHLCSSINGAPVSYSTPVVKSESSGPSSWLSWVINPDDDFIWLWLKLVSKLTPPHVNPSWGNSGQDTKLISYNHLTQPTLGNGGITVCINRTLAKYSKLLKLTTLSSTLPNIKAHFQTQAGMGTSEFAS